MYLSDLSQGFEDLCITFFLVWNKECILSGHSSANGGTIVQISGQGETRDMCVAGDCVPLLLSGIYAATVHQVPDNESD